MKTTHREKFIVKFHEIDFKGRVKLFSIMDYIQHTGEVHGTNIGMGFEQMVDKGLFWVVSRMKLDIYRYPGVGEVVIVDTELGGRDKLFWVRKFILRDERENIIGNATVYYLILDLYTRFPQKPGVCPIDLNIDVKINKEDALRKIKMPDEVTESKHRELYYNDIDANNHVNNAKYVSFVEDSFSLEWHENYEISSIQINYIKEIKANDKLVINKFKVDNEENICFINGVYEESDKEFFQCKLSYRS